MDQPALFKDEWLVKAALTLPGASRAAIDKLRGPSRPYLSQVLIEQGLTDKEALREAVFKTHGFAYAEPLHTAVEKLAVSLVPEKICRRRLLVPLRVVGETIELAMVNPLDHDAQTDVQAATGRTPVPFFCLPQRVETLITELYSPEAIVYDILSRIDDWEAVEVLENEDAEEKAASGPGVQKPIMNLVDAIISRAVRMHASDIHIEHEERSSSVRYRIDGALKNVMNLPRHIASGPVVSRIKIMADLDLADHMRPQDGRAKIKIGKTEFGLRVSTLPTNFGEKVVLRVLDPRAAKVSFEKLGLSPDAVARLEPALKSSQGVLLVTGPTGSGKTTTLYTFLNQLKSSATNIITVEDPIEYKLEGINQVQVNEKQGLSFAGVLRSALRQDPDIIMVGEIRDRETADIAFQAALTGHLVLTTLHTNDALSAMARLMDMGVERFKIAPALLMITAQRLVRRLCAACRVPVEDGHGDHDALEALAHRGLPRRYFKPGGCSACDLGYSGRLMLLETLAANQPLKDRISAGDGEAALRETAVSSGALKTMLDDALAHLSAGDTSLEEISSYVTIERAGAVPAAAPAAVPAVPVPAKTPAPPPPPDAPKPASASRRVLVVDDDPAIRLILGALLKNAGYAVEEAEDGAQALKRMATDCPDLMILDLNMPNIDGHDVIRALRQTLGLTTFPIIMLTANSDDKSQEETINLGADDYIIKPFKPAVVLARVNAAFRRMGRP